ncbi:hypothetical protein [Jeongeupia naejangsanensis]|uniref:Uncharacterized protein n=1 Tax=Jeongeupia naejangsanensis TaxID=613195 RepID=A0ABS2BHA0_9NEIS|nr:hypothetical protein [Jeongeupia naejangsanensis]MBM3114989.1 hypothetical protein [Jeongeupia naejangsanensis]
MNQIIDLYLLAWAASVRVDHLQLKRVKVAQSRYGELAGGAFGGTDEHEVTVLGSRCRVTPDTVYVTDARSQRETAVEQAKLKAVFAVIGAMDTETAELLRVHYTIPASVDDKASRAGVSGRTWNRWVRDAKVAFGAQFWLLTQGVRQRGVGMLIENDSKTLDSLTG